MGELFVYSAFLGIFFFLLPIFVRVDAYVDARENKLWFSLSLYRFFRVFGGYAELRREGLVLHLTENKAVIVPFAQMGSTRKKFEITKGFQLYSFHQIVETGGASSPYGALIGAFFQSAAGQVFSVLQTAHPFLSLRSSVLLSERPVLKWSVRTTAVFNGLVLTVAIGKKILEAIINWIRKRKSTASWKKQPSN